MESKVGIVHPKAVLWIKGTGGAILAEYVTLYLD